MVCDNVVCDREAAEEEEDEEEEEEEEERDTESKQEPHTKMWGKTQSGYNKHQNDAQQ